MKFTFQTKLSNDLNVSDGYSITEEMLHTQTRTNNSMLLASKIPMRNATVMFKSFLANIPDGNQQGMLTSLSEVHSC